MMPMKSVAVFCAASEDIDRIHFSEAEAVGRMLGGRGAALVYGGARFGLMEATAETCCGGAVEGCQLSFTGTCRNCTN